MDFRGSSAGKESTCNAGDPSSIPRLRRTPGKGIGYTLQYSCASLLAQMVKNPSTMRETWVWSLGQEDPWRGAWQPTPVFLPGESTWTEKPGRLQSMELQRVEHNWAIKHSTAFYPTSKLFINNIIREVTKYIKQGNFFLKISTFSPKKNFFVFYRIL